MAAKPDLFALLARSAGLNQKAIERLFGSVRVTVVGIAKAEDPSVGAKQLELGLGLKDILKERKLSPTALPDGLLSTVAQVIKDYSSSCPQVFAWLGRGDFNAQKVPPEIKRGLLLHACRTAGRLRAAVLRSSTWAT